MTDAIRLEVWFDYTCPYVYTAALLLDRVERVYGDRLSVEWRSFPLEQANNIQGLDWKLWEQPDDYRSRGIWALRAGEAAKLQGREAFKRFHYALLTARHEERRDISDRAVLEEIAGKADLDADRFRHDLADRSLLARIGEDYNRGTEQHGIWGTPTLVFEGGQAAYVKMRPAPPEEESVRVFEELIDVIRGRPYVMEIKRPR